MPTVYVPGKGTVYFPDGMSQSDMENALSEETDAARNAQQQSDSEGSLTHYARAVGHTYMQSLRGIAQLSQEHEAGPADLAQSFATGNYLNLIPTLIGEGSKAAGFDKKALQEAEAKSRVEMAPVLRTTAGWAGNIEGNLQQAVLTAAPTMGAGAAPAAGAAARGLIGSTLAGAARGAASGALTGTGMGAIRPLASDQESRGANMAEGAAGGALFGGAVGGIAGAVPPIVRRFSQPFTQRLTPNLEDARDVLLSHGVQPDAAQMTGSSLARKAKTFAQDASLVGAPEGPATPEGQKASFTRAVLRFIGVDADYASDPVMNAGIRVLKNAYNDFATRLQPVADMQLETDLGQIAQDASRSLREADLNRIHQTIDDIDGDFKDNGGRMPGNLWQKTMTALDHFAQDPQLAPVAGEIRGAMIRALHRQADPADLVRLGVLDQRYAAAMAIQKAVMSDNTVSPSQLASALDVQSKYATVWGRGNNQELSELANAGNALLGRTLNTANSGTTERAALQTLTGRLVQSAGNAVLGKAAQRLVYGEESLANIGQYSGAPARANRVALPLPPVGNTTAPAPTAGPMGPPKPPPTPPLSPMAQLTQQLALNTAALQARGGAQVGAGTAPAASAAPAASPAATAAPAPGGHIDADALQAEIQRIRGEAGGGAAPAAAPPPSQEGLQQRLAAIREASHETPGAPLKMTANPAHDLARTALAHGGGQEVQLSDGSSVRLVHVESQSGTRQIYAFDSKGNVVGEYGYGTKADGPHPVADVDPELWRRGIGRAMQQMARAHGGYIPATDDPTAIRSERGQAWREGMDAQDAAAGRAPAPPQQELTPAEQGGRHADEINLTPEEVKGLIGGGQAPPGFTDRQYAGLLARSNPVALGAVRLPANAERRFTMQTLRANAGESFGRISAADDRDRELFKTQGQPGETFEDFQERLSREEYVRLERERGRYAPSNPDAAPRAVADLVASLKKGTGGTPPAAPAAGAVAAPPAAQVSGPAIPVPPAAPPSAGPAIPLPQGARSQFSGILDEMRANDDARRLRNAARREMRREQTGRFGPNPGHGPDIPTE